jgi:hypothetical protein
MRISLINRLGLSAAAVFAFSGAVAQADVLYTGSPNATVTLTETSPGQYGFSEEYLWRDENGPNSATETTLGSWASRTWAYDADQSDSIGNTIMVGTGDPGHTQFVQYKVIIPVDQAYLGTVTVESVLRGGVVARAYANDAANPYAAPSLFSEGSNSYTMHSNTVPLSSMDVSIPNQVSFELFLDQEAGNFAGSIDSLSIGATTVPEPASLGMIGAAGLLLLRRRRKNDSIN